MKLQANTVRGVWEVNEFDDNVKVVDQYEFRPLLPMVKEGETLAANVVDSDEFVMIEIEYGIEF